MIGMLSIGILSYKGKLDYDAAVLLGALGFFELVFEAAIVGSLVDKLV